MRWLEFYFFWFVSLSWSYSSVQFKLLGPTDLSCWTESLLRDLHFWLPPTSCLMLQCCGFCVEPFILYPALSSALSVRTSVCLCSSQSLSNSVVLSCFLPGRVSVLSPSLSVLRSFCLVLSKTELGILEPVLNLLFFQIHSKRVLIKKHGCWFQKVRFWVGWLCMHQHYSRTVRVFVSREPVK